MAMLMAVIKALLAKVREGNSARLACRDIQQAINQQRVSLVNTGLANVLVLAAPRR